MAFESFRTRKRELKQILQFIFQYLCIAIRKLHQKTDYRKGI